MKFSPLGLLLLPFDACWGRSRVVDLFELTLVGRDGCSSYLSPDQESDGWKKSQRKLYRRTHVHVDN